MTPTILARDRIRRYLAAPTNGILGLTDEFLAAAREGPLRIDWTGGRCQLQTCQPGQQEAGQELSLSRPHFRAVLARIAVLCHQHQANSVSPYGGTGKVSFGAAPHVLLHVTFVNTPDEQRLELAPIRQGNGGNSVSGEIASLADDTTGESQQVIV